MVFGFGKKQSTSAPVVGQVVMLTSGTQWIVPTNWNNAANTIEVIAPGGAGAAPAVGNGGAGGGGGGCLPAPGPFD